MVTKLVKRVQNYRNVCNNSLRRDMLLYGYRFEQSSNYNKSNIAPQQVSEVHHRFHLVNIGYYF